MRTSRVHSITSSVFRNSRQYLQTNERIFRLLDEGEANRQSSGQQQNGSHKRESSARNPQAPIKRFRKQEKSIILSGVHSDAHSVANRHNRLLEKTSKLKHTSKKSQINTYRSSI